MNKLLRVFEVVFDWDDHEGFVWDLFGWNLGPEVGGGECPLFDVAGFDLGVYMAGVAEGSGPKTEDVVLAHDVRDHFAGFGVFHVPLGVLEPRLGVELVGFPHLFENGPVDDYTPGADCSDFPVLVSWDR